MTATPKTKAKILAIVLTIVAPITLCMTQSSGAAPATGTSLIDKDFEVAIRKFISKRFYNRIDATDEQRSKLDTIWMETMESTRADREKLRQGMLQLSNLMASDDATDEQIKQKVDELQTMREKLKEQRLNSVLKARKVLTKEQRLKINERITEIISGGLKPRRIGFLLDHAAP